MSDGATAPDQPEVRAVRAGDAAGLVRCVRRCYGGGYPHEAYYDAARLYAQIDAGELGGVVAVAGGSLIGHIAIRPGGPGATVCEAGTTIVDPDQRRRGVMRALAAGLAAECRRRDLTGFVHFPTTAHEVMQRASIAAGGRETGILVGYIPATTADTTIGRSAQGRLAVTVVHQPLAPAPAQTGFVPARYRPTVERLAAELRLERRWETLAPPTARSTRLVHSSDAARGLARIAVEQVGADVGDVAAAAAALDAELVHVDLAMSDPAIDHAARALLRVGFVYGAWLPGWAGADVLRLQRVRDRLGERPQLVSPAAAALLALIHDDERSGSGAERG